MSKRPLLTRESKERKVIELYEKGLNIRQIAKRVRMSFGDIGKITRKYSGDEGIIQDTKKLNKHSHALELFRTGHSNLEVAIKVGLTDSETLEELRQYRRLLGMDKFCEFYDAMKDELDFYLQIYAELSYAGLTIRDAIEGLGYARRIVPIKLEYIELQNSIQQNRYESFEVWKTLQSLKQERDSISSQLEHLKIVENARSDEHYAVQPNNGEPVFRARRRRRIHRSSDEFQTGGPAS